MFTPPRPLILLSSLHSSTMCLTHTSLTSHDQVHFAWSANNPNKLVKWDDSCLFSGHRKVDSGRMVVIVEFPDPQTVLSGNIMHMNACWTLVPIVGSSLLWNMSTVCWIGVHVSTGAPWVQVWLPEAHLWAPLSGEAAGSGPRVTQRGVKCHTGLAFGPDPLLEHTPRVTWTNCLSTTAGDYWTRFSIYFIWT